MRNNMYAGLTAWMVMVLLIIFASETKKPLYKDTLVSCAIVSGTLALKKLSPKIAEHGEKK